MLFMICILHLYIHDNLYSELIRTITVILKLKRVFLSSQYIMMGLMIVLSRQA